MTENEAIGRSLKCIEVSRSLGKPVNVPNLVLERLIQIKDKTYEPIVRSKPTDVTLIWASTLEVFVVEATQRVRPLIQLSLPGIS